MEAHGTGRWPTAARRRPTATASRWRAAARWPIPAKERGDRATTWSGWPRRRSGPTRTSDEWAPAWAKETGLPLGRRPGSRGRGRDQPIPLDDTVVDSEQQLADAFTDGQQDLRQGRLRRVRRPAASTPTRHRARSNDEHQAALVPAHPRRRPHDRRTGPRPGPPWRRGPARAGHRLPGPGRPRRRAARLRRRAHPDRHVVRGRLADHGRADPRDDAAEVPGRVPPGVDLARRWPRRWPPRSSGSPAAGCCSTSSPAATPVEQRRFGDCARPRRALRAHRRVPDHRARRLRPAAAGRLRRRSTCASTARRRWPRRTRCRRSTSAARSDAALPVAARHADVYLTWGEPPAQVAEKIGRVRELAADQGRMRFGIRLHTITPGHLGRSVGGGAEAPGRARPGRRSPRRRRGSRRASRSASSGWSRCTAGRLRRHAGDPPEPVGGRRAGPRRRGHRARRQPRRGRRPDRGVPRARHRGVHPVRLPAPRGGVLVRRGRAAGAGPAWFARRYVAPVSARRELVPAL